MDYHTNKIKYYRSLYGRTVSVFTNNLGDFLKVIFLIEIPITLLSYYSFNSIISPSQEEISGYPILGTLLIMVVFTFITMIPFISYCMISYGGITNKKYSINQLLSESLRNMVPCVVAQFLAGVKIFFGIILFIIPGIKWSVDYAFVPIVTLMKKITGQESLYYSQNLVKQEWWFVFGAEYLFIVLIFSVSLLQKGLLFGIEQNLINSIIFQFIILIIGVLFRICMMILYLDLENSNYSA